MREKQIETNLVNHVKKQGGMCIKLTPVGFKGMPDRLILYPGGKLYFAELKAPGKKLRPLQQKRKEQLESLGFTVYVIDSTDGVKEVMPK